MIVVTGGAGFIGSAIVWRLNQLGNDNILIVDELGIDEKWKNLTSLKFADYMNKWEFLDKIESGIDFNIEAIIHMGANSSTTEKDADHLIENNYEYTKSLAQYSIKNNIRFIYASSAATYGDGSLGFADNEGEINNLRPLNMYGYSKQLFDLWVLNNKFDRVMTGVKFFNVFGPNEYHKGEMMSVVCKKFLEVSQKGRIGLFKSYRDDYKDGEQKRDFIYVKDAVDVLMYFLKHPEKSGIFNLGSGVAHSWNDLAKAMFSAIGKEPYIEYIDMPETLRQKYQYFTQAKMDKLRKTGYKTRFMPLEKAVEDYTGYLKDKKYL